MTITHCDLQKESAIIITISGENIANSEKDSHAQKILETFQKTFQGSNVIVVYDKMLNDIIFVNKI